MWPLWQAACVGQTVFNPGEAKNTYGTGCFMLMQTGDRCSSRATCNKQRTTGDTQRGPPPAHLMPCALHSARQRLGARRLSEGSPNCVVNDRPFWLPAAHACASALGHPVQRSTFDARAADDCVLPTRTQGASQVPPFLRRRTRTRTRMHARSRTQAHAHAYAPRHTRQGARAHARAHTRAHTQVCA